MRKPFSVVGTDKDALTNLIGIHAVPDPRIIDVTANEGRMWRGLPYKPHRSDVDPHWLEAGLADTVADFRSLPFADGSFDVEVIDPPHIEDAGNMATDYVADFGLGNIDGHVADLFKPALIEASRVLVKTHGIVLVKIIDYVHGTSMQWQWYALLKAAFEVGMTPCDVQIVVQWQRGGLNDPKWKHVNHLRNVHAFWQCIRNGPDNCVSAYAPSVDFKPRTGELFAALEGATA